jgi:hypothetical protein
MRVTLTMKDIDEHDPKFVDRVDPTEVAKCNGNSFEVDSEVNLSAIELRDLLSEKPLQQPPNASIPLPKRAVTDSGDDATVVWSFD